MSLSSTDIEALLEEIQPVITNGWIQKVHQPQDLSLVLEIRSHGTSHLLYCCVDPRWARLHLLSKRYPNPPAPPSFCRFLRSHIEGGRVEQIIQQPGDRLVYLTIHKKGTCYQVVIALTGKRANIYILNEGDVLLRSLKNSRFQVGDRFVPPPIGPSSSFVKLPPPWKDARNQKDSNHDTIFSSTYPLSTATETYYGQLAQQDNEKRLHDQQLAATRKLLKRAKGTLCALEKDLRKAEGYREHGRYGELMKSALHTIRKGQDSVTLTDYCDPKMPTLTLPLDPAKDPVGNMKDYFRKYQKYLGAQQHLLPRIELQQNVITKLQKELAHMEKGPADADLASKSAIAIQQSHIVRRSTTQSPKATGHRTYVSSDGYCILVGKTAKDNEHLTFKTGKPDDLWLHARGTPGSHTIIQLKKSEKVPHETLKDAATLTLWFSDLRKSGKGEVLYTLRKFVRKAKGQKPGAVHVTREKSLWIEIQKDRLARLKKTTK